MACRRESICRSWLLAALVRTGWIAMAPLLSLIVLAGCKTADYRGATMPAELRAPPANRVAHMDIAGMVGPGTGTNQINPGDLLAITVASGRNEEGEKKPIQVRVASDGTVDAPPIGPVPVAGLEPVTAEQQITQAAIARGVFVRPSVTLQVVKPAVNRITVLGAVMDPGVKELPKGSSDLARALASAGGLTEEASTKVDVLRYSTQSFLADAGAHSPAASASGVRLASYNSNAVSSNGEMNPPQTMRIDLAQVPEKNIPNYSLGDRDVVMVLPHEKQIIHVTGLVHQPNQFELPHHQDVTVLDAIAMAGGISSPVADKVFVIRRFPNMPKPAVIQVSIADAKRDGNENLRLASGDLVSVERTMSTVMVDTVMTVFRVGFSVGGNLVAF
jgi:protein involved in polysaccharide export with SLBB domain